MYISQIINILFWPVLIVVSYYASIWMLTKVGMLKTKNEA